MSTLYVTEYNDVNAGSPQEPAIADHAVSFTGTAGNTAAFNAKTVLVRVHVDGIACVKIGAGAVAVAGTDKRMPAGATEYFAVSPGTGARVSAVTHT